MLGASLVSVGRKYDKGEPLSRKRRGGLKIRGVISSSVDATSTDAALEREGLWS